MYRKSLTIGFFRESLQKFVQGLSILSRGTLEEKLCWTFQLYDINSDGHITKEEMNDIVTAVYNLMGHPLEEKIDDERIKAKVDRIFEVSKKKKLQLTNCPRLSCAKLQFKFFFIFLLLPNTNSLNHSKQNNCFTMSSKLLWQLHSSLRILITLQNLSLNSFGTKRDLFFDKVLCIKKKCQHVLYEIKALKPRAMNICVTLYSLDIRSVKRIFCKNCSSLIIYCSFVLFFISIRY